MNFEFPAEVYLDESYRENYLKSQTFRNFVKMGGLSGMSAESIIQTERQEKKGDIILIFNDSADEVEYWKTSKEEELVRLLDKISAQNLVDIA